MHITINGIFELGVRESVPHVGMWSLSTADSMHFMHAIAPFAFEKRLCQICASSGEIVGSVWLPWAGVPGAAAALVRGHWQNEDVCVRESRSLREENAKPKALVLLHTNQQV